MSSSKDDLKAHAASTEDFYALLDISPAAAETEIRRAYRRTALKYHPDKIANPTPADIDKFHLLQIAYDVLSDPAVRQLYDNAREARQRKQREREMMDSAKRKMREDLEARERAGAAGQQQQQQRGVKRSWMGTTADGDDDAEAKLQREIDRIAEDGRRRRREAEEKIKLEMEEEERLMRLEEEEARKAADRSSQKVDRSREGGGTNVPELERGVKVRWVREGRGFDLDAERLRALFAPFGKVENVLLLKDKRQRLGDKREKKTVATGVVIFASIVSAHAAVLDGEKKKASNDAGSDWSVVESVFWASGAQPELGAEASNGTSSSAPGSAADSAPTPAAAPKPSFNFAGLKAAGTASAAKGPAKAPSFGSFASAAASSPKPAPTAGAPNGSSAPSLEELTLMRLRNAQREKERKALEEQLRKEDEAADAAEAAAAQAS
ncbi:putative cell cycle control protein (Cwf23) [Aspergillus aculeatinus CBS 121060]|uniref:DnaJ-domain-containing protein n=1 Tax=Aspergillus aculeatinus CBS 121060 TaxID=1448322 RepID=A0ACD1HA49_9EURO|nr:DnaJ-domain-containing protein [Aspergillus aculeatinus CBS 121060]RAH70297.1 DnaJ-domain-containing protein [Aspergillus aculeatinus CBS 121060]